MEEFKCDNCDEFAKGLLNVLGDIYFFKMYDAIKSLNIPPKELTGFLVNPEKIIFYIGKTHIAMELYGNEVIDTLKDTTYLEVKVFDYTKDDEKEFSFFEKVVGFKHDSTMEIDFKIPILEINEELIIPTNKGMDKLIELNWNFAAQNNIISFNSGGFYVPVGQFARLINCIFFHADDSGLITRRVKWMDFIPLKYAETSNCKYDKFVIDLSHYLNYWLEDLLYKYPLPEDYKYKKLEKINKFIEVFGNKENSEPIITSYLGYDENKFILNMAFFAKDIYSQLECKWQSEDKIPIKPDFFVVKPNKFADIVEFKLPQLKSTAITGIINREKFSSEIESYIAQTRVYKKYFEDPNNRTWFENKYGFKVYNPRRYLVIGRRWDFDSVVWMEIKSEYPDLEIITYDDLIDGVISQFYI